MKFEHHHELPYEGWFFIRSTLLKTTLETYKLQKNTSFQLKRKKIHSNLTHHPIFRKKPPLWPRSLLKSHRHNVDGAALKASFHLIKLGVARLWTTFSSLLSSLFFFIHFFGGVTKIAATRLFLPGMCVCMYVRGDFFSTDS